PSLQGGAEAFGLASFTASQALVKSVFENAPAGTVAGIFRLDAGVLNLQYDFAGYDLVLLANLTQAPITTPQFGSGLQAGAASVTNPLQVGGLGRDPIFGGSGQQTLTQLNGDAVYVTLVPSNIKVFNFQGLVGGKSFSISGAPLLNGQAQYVTLNTIAQIDQTLPPTGTTFGGSNWQSLGTIRTAEVQRGGEVTAASVPAPIVITSQSHGLSNGEIVVVSDVKGNTAANGQWIVTKINDNQFSLNGSSGNAPFTGIGSWSADPIKFTLAAATDGSVAADALRLVRVDNTVDRRAVDVLSNLQVLSLTNNPLNNEAHQYFIGSSPSFALNNSRIPGLTFSSNPNAPLLAAIASRQMSSGSSSIIAVNATDANVGSFSYSAVSNDTSRLQVSLSGNNLTLNTQPGVSGIVRVTVTATDGPRAGQYDLYGRSDQQSFDVSIGLGAIYGTLVDDLDADGQFDTNEAGVEGQSIYVDRNGNGRLDPNEPLTTTDANGAYQFLGDDIKLLVPTPILVAEKLGAPDTTPSAGASNAAVSLDGRWIAFSTTSQLVSGDTNGLKDIYVRDTTTGVVTLVSQTFSGAAGNGTSDKFFISPDGRFIVFDSFSTNLVTNVTDTNGKRDLFVRDLQTNSTQIISRNSNGSTTANGTTLPFGFSPNGQLVLLQSDSSDMVTGVTDTNAVIDLFVYNLQSGSLQLISQSSTTATAANGAATAVAFSPNSQYVLFTSLATNSVTGVSDSNGIADILVRDIVNNVTKIVTLAASGAATATGGSSTPVGFSPNSQYVLVDTSATNLVSGVTDTNNNTDVYVRDLVNNTTRLISASSTSTITANSLSKGVGFSPDSLQVLFESMATNILATTDGNGYRDVFVRTLSVSPAPVTS
ncbi:MAG: TolB family protein, partial [Planctomycetota bacterium]